MGSGSGLGSEFNTFLISSLLTAVALERRMVYYRSKRKWEYDCQNERGWACYLTFPCEEIGVDETALDYSQKYLIKDASSLKIPNMQFDRKLSPRNDKIYSIINSFSVPGSIKCNVNTANFSVTMLTCMAANYLYQLNAHTKAAIQQINSHYPLNQASHLPYIAVQLRMTDKRYEMSKEAWNWMTNLQNTAKFIRPYFKSAHTNKLFIGNAISLTNC